MLEGSSELPETFAGCNESALQRSDTSCETSRDKRRFTPSYFPFLTSWEAIASAETGHWRGDCRDLPVRLFIVFHASRLECEKSMSRTVSDQQFLRFPSSLVSRAVAALSASGPPGDCRKCWYRSSHSASQQGMWFDRRPRGMHFFAAVLITLQKHW